MQTRRSIAKKFKETWQFGLSMQASDVTQTHLETWLGRHRKKLRKSSYNEYIRFLRHLFANAVKSLAIAESPATGLAELKRENPIRLTPAWELFQAIPQNIRRQTFADAEDSAELLEFMGLAGVGTAEAYNPKRENIDFRSGDIHLFRSNTDQGYKFPFSLNCAHS